MSIFTQQAQQWFEDRGLEPSKDGKVQVSLYAVDRHYGGAEEGGWYYDTYEFTGLSERVPVQEIEAAKARLENLYAEEQPRYSIESVLSDGPEYRACVEFLAGESEMLAKPSYS